MVSSSCGSASSDDVDRREFGGGERQAAHLVNRPASTRYRPQQQGELAEVHLGHRHLR
jgi:hypothetical protein